MGNEKKIKFTVEQMTIDTLAKVYILWLDHQKEFLKTSDYFKDSESRKKQYLALFASMLNNPEYNCKVARKGRDIIGFMIGKYLKRLLEPSHVFVLDYIYVVPKYRNMDIANSIIEDLKLDMKIVGATHIEGTTTKELIDGIFKDYKIVEYRISKEI